MNRLLRILVLKKAAQFQPGLVKFGCHSECLSEIPSKPGLPSPLFLALAAAYERSCCILVHFPGERATFHLPLIVTYVTKPIHPSIVSRCRNPFLISGIYLLYEDVYINGLPNWMEEKSEAFDFGYMSASCCERAKSPYVHGHQPRIETGKPGSNIRFAIACRFGFCRRHKKAVSL